MKRDKIVVSYRGCAAVLYIPAAFTPNSDDLNDFVGMVALLGRWELKLYNRSGQLLFARHNPASGWDGRYQGMQQPAGVYVCVGRFRNDAAQVVVNGGRWR